MRKPTEPIDCSKSRSLEDRPPPGLVLAGSRGPTDPVASAAGLPHKALVPVCGVPMLERVVSTLFAAESIGHVIISADAALLDHGFGPALTSEIEDGRITLATPKASPSESVAHVLVVFPRKKASRYWWRPPITRC